MFSKYTNIRYHLYVCDQIYTPFDSFSDSDMIQMPMFNCITDVTEWFYNNSLSLNMTITDTIILSRLSSHLSIIY